MVFQVGEWKFVVQAGQNQFLLVISHDNAALHRGFLSPAGTFISRVPC